MADRVDKVAETVRSYVDSYDFFGYLIPGSISIAVGTYCIAVVKNPTLDILGFINLVGEQGTKAFFLSVSVLVLASFIMGHVTATVSAYLYDKILVGKIIGYPYLFILDLEDFAKHKPKKGDSTNDYMAWNMLLFVSLLPLGFDDRRARSIFVGILMLVLLVIVAHIVKKTGTVSWMQRVPVYSPIFLLIAIPLVVVWLVDLVCLGLAKVFYANTNFIFQSLQLQHHISREMRERIFENFEALFKKKIDPSMQTDIFWAIHLYLMDRDSWFQRASYKWLVLHGLLRNISGAFLLNCPLLAFVMHWYPFFHRDLVIMYFASYALSLALMIRWYYIYYNYHSKSIFRRFAIIDPEQEITVKTDTKR